MNDAAQNFYDEIVRTIAGATPVPIVHNLKPFEPLAATELRAWRIFGAGVAPLLDRVLAAQGDAAEADLISLQHSLAELLRSPANISRST